MHAIIIFIKLKKNIMKKVSQEVVVVRQQGAHIIML